MSNIPNDVECFLNMLSSNQELSFDTETNGLQWQHCHVVGYAVSDGKDAFYVPVRHTGGDNIDNVELFEKEINDRIKLRTKRLILWNAKFDMHFCENHGIHLENNVVDGMVMEALLNENRRSYSLDNIAKHYNITPKQGKVLYAHIAEKFGCKPDRSAMGIYHLLSGIDPLAREYSKGDVITTKQLYEAQKKDLYAQELDTIANIENQLTYVLQKMERRGVRVDPDEADRVKTEVHDLYWEAYAKIPKKENEFGDIESINVRSAKDLKEYFELCEIDDWPMTLPTQRFPQGQPSFKKDYLSTHQEGVDILNVRKLAHLRDSFLDVLDQHVFNDKIHTTFNQTRGETHGTRSGRLSSSRPNMQQVPKRDKPLGKIYRRIFVPRRDYIFVEYDYSQAEPRLYAHYSSEPALIKGYNSTPFIDMHTIAAGYMNVSRDVAKNLNLGIMYTMGAAKLAIQLGISYDEALKILKTWHKRFPRVSDFTRKAEAVAEDRGYVHTILGRRSHFDDPRFAYRAANRIIQGGSADILKFKMVEIDNYLVANNLEEVCQMILNIHDALAFEIHKDYLHLIPIIQTMLERVQVPPFNLRIPFVAEYKTGSNWSEATYGTELNREAA